MAQKDQNLDQNQVRQAGAQQPERSFGAQQDKGQTGTRPTDTSRPGRSESESKEADANLDSDMNRSPSTSQPNQKSGVQDSKKSF